MSQHEFPDDVKCMLTRARNCIFVGDMHFLMNNILQYTYIQVIVALIFTVIGCFLLIFDVLVILLYYCIMHKVYTTI